MPFLSTFVDLVQVGPDTLTLEENDTTLEGFGDLDRLRQGGEGSRTAELPVQVVGEQFTRKAGVGDVVEIGHGGVSLVDHGLIIPSVPEKVNRNFVMSCRLMSPYVPRR